MKKIYKKKFGQNFLINKNFIKIFINFLNIKKNDYIIEIGPGYGSITKNLIKLVKKLYIIEIDKYLVKFLKKNLTFKNLIIYNYNILNFNFNLILNLSRQKLRFIGSLPYNISVLILLKLIKFSYKIKDQLFILQKEISKKLIAKFNSKFFCKLSILIQLKYNIKIILNVKNIYFFPKPKVNSSVVYMVPIKYPIKIKMYFIKLILNKIFINKKILIIKILKNILNKYEIINLNINYKNRPISLSKNNYINLSNYILSKLYKF